jgi:hypothetical protein
MKARAVPSVAACLSVLALGACDPCFGVSSCGSDPRLAIEGTLVGHITGRPVSGVVVDVIRTGGVELSSDSVSTVTGADGYWRVGVPAHATGEVIVDINVRAKDFATYRVRGMHVLVTDRRGQGTILPAWVVDPHFPYAAELHYRGPQDVRVEGATVEFHRTSGPGFYVAGGGDAFSGQTDVAGRIVLFHTFAHATSLDDLIGDLIVHPPAPFAVDTIRGLRLAPSQLLDAQTQVIVLTVGPSLNYLGEFRLRRTSGPLAGVRVAFQRTSGIAVSPESFSAVSDASGRFTFPLRALGEGKVVGTLSVTPPSPDQPFVLNGLELTPFRADTSRIYDVWAIGPMPLVGQGENDSRGVQGVVADSRRQP